MKNDYQKLKKIDDENYNVEKDCPFEINSGVPFEFICETFEIISEIKGQNSKEKQKDILSKMFGTIYKNSRHNLEKAYYFCTLRLAPDYICKEIGIGDQIIIKALSKTTGRTEK
jgi:GMP synthase PP-ATPase subunit